MKQTEKKSKRLWVLVSVALLALLVSSASFIWHQAKWVRIHKQAEALGIFNAPPEIEERHVWISEHELLPGRHGDVPVHIMFRRGISEAWHLRGTGLLLGWYPGSLLTAYHVFEGSPGQYGCRRIGPKEFTGGEAIIPIISCSYNGQADDAVLAKVDPAGMDFPLIEVPVSSDMVRNWPNQDLVGEIWPAAIRFTTYPEKGIRGVLTVKIRPDVSHVYLDWPVMPGESGTVAIVDTEQEDIYLVVIRQQIFPAEILDQLSPEGKEIVNWSEGKIYSVGHLVQLKPPVK